MKISPYLLGVAVLGAGAMLMSKPKPFRTLTGGRRYSIVARAVGPSGTDWKSVYDELEGGKAASRVVITGKGDTRKMTFQFAPPKTIKLEIGKPMFQLAGGRVSCVLLSVGAGAR